MTDAGRAANPTAVSDAEPGFDELLQRLRAVVERLEGGKLTLEQSLAAYEEGVSLARRGHAQLDRAEKRVELLVRAGQGGVEVAPFEDGAGGDADANDPDAGRGA